MAALKAKGLPTYSDREMFMELIHASGCASRDPLGVLEGKGGGVLSLKNQS